MSETNNAQCATHTQLIADLRGDLATYHAENTALLRAVQSRIDIAEARAAKHSADIRTLRESQDSEVKYWRLGKRIALWAGAPAILGWIVYIAGIFKGVK